MYTGYNLSCLHQDVCACFYFYRMKPYRIDVTNLLHGTDMFQRLLNQMHL
jgi:hypothetical protein